MGENQPYSDEKLQQAIRDAQEKLIILGNEVVPQLQRTTDHIWFTRLTRAEDRRRWKIISPSILFRDLSEKILYAGNHRYFDFFKQVRRFWFQFVEDMERKYGKYHPDLWHAGAQLKTIP